MRLTIENYSAIISLIVVREDGHFKVERSGENLRCHAGEKLEDFETHFRIKWC
jgi:hypothetical protein